MSVREIVQREVGAIKRDIEWERGWKDQIGRPLEECMKHWDEYPSVLTRLKNIRGRVYRAKTNVVEFPYAVKNFIHRGRHGWATPDTWSMDYTLAKQLEGVFREFVRVSSDMIDYEQDHTDKIALQIADAFQAYHEFVDRDWDLDFAGDNINEQLAEKDRQFEEVHENLKKALQLMGEHYPALWW